jgi:hypothetical protein
MSDAVALEATDDSVGPAPWYWKTFKPVVGSAAQRFAWRLADHGKGRLCVFLESEAGELKFVAHTYTRVLPLGTDLFAAWFPVLSETPPRGVCELRVTCFDTGKLPTLPGPAQSDGRTYYSSGVPPISEFSVPVGLSAGDNNLQVPREFNTISEMLIVGNHAGDNATTAVYAVYPQLGRVTVLPQLWFKGFDDGYQWISRVTRHPVSRALIGDGVRIGKFQLTEDGCHLARWIAP